MGDEESKGIEGEKRQKQSQFEEKSLDKDYWDRVEKDLKV